MKNWIMLFCIALCVQAYSDAFSQPSASMEMRVDTLRIRILEAVVMALERNPELSIQRLDPIIARSYVTEQRSAFDPDLTASAIYNKTKLQRFLGARPEPFEMTSQRYQFDAGILETLPTGTSLSVNASMIGSLSSIYTDQYSGEIGMTITQSLLRGFGTGVHLAMLRRANLDLEISKEELKAVAMGLVADVEMAYWDLYLKYEEIRIQQNAYDLANRQLEETLERVAVGKLPELELASVRAEVATRKEALIDAQSQYEQSRLSLLLLLNPEDPAWSIVPLPLDVPFIPRDSIDALSVHEELGMRYRPDLNQARMEFEKGKIDLIRTKNGLLPLMDVFVTLGKTSYAKSFNDALPDVGSPFYSIDAGLSIEFPLLNRSASAQVLRAKKSKEQAALALENMTRLVQWDIRSAYIEVKRTRQQIEATRATRELQDQNLAAEVEKFRVGKSTNLQVLQVQRDFTASRLDEVRAMVLYLNSLIALYRVEGSLLERRGIQTPGSP